MFMPLIALLAFWYMVIQLWRLGSIRLALYMIGSWSIALGVVIYLNRIPYFMIFEAMMVIIMICVEKVKYTRLK